MDGNGLASRPGGGGGTAVAILLGMPHAKPAKAPAV